MMLKGLAGYKHSSLLDGSMSDEDKRLMIFLITIIAIKLVSLSLMLRTNKLECLFIPAKAFASRALHHNNNYDSN
jgi:hypothetical protein